MFLKARSLFCRILIGELSPRPISCLLTDYSRPLKRLALILILMRRILAVNAISLACAVSANIALLINMSGKGRFEISQPITIIGFSVAAIMLISIVGKASTNAFLQAGGKSASLTQAYYYAIWASGLYVLISLLMIFTVWGALSGKYDRLFQLTPSQRTLMLQNMSFMAYLLIGALIYSYLEHWKYLDAVFFANFTLLTIGLGSPFAPTTHSGRAVLFPYAIGGVITVGLIVSSIRSMLIETGKQKMEARETERQRQNVRSLTGMPSDFHSRSPGPQQIKAALPEARDSKLHGAQLSEKQIRRLEFHRMRRIQKNARLRSKWSSLAASTSVAAMLWFIGALIFMHTESEQGWSYFASLYFCFVILLTIGYGDLQPTSPAGRSFFVLWSLLAVPALTMLISDMSDTIVRAISEATDWIGSVTILPGEAGFGKVWKQGINKFTGRPWLFRADDADDFDDDKEQGRPPAGLRQHSGAVLAPSKRYDGEKEKHYGTPTRMLRVRLTDDEFAAAQSLCDEKSSTSATEGERMECDRRFHRFLLGKEIGALLSESGSDPPIRYTYDEWAYFLLLLGHREDDPKLHRRPDQVKARSLSMQRRDSGIIDGPRLGQIQDADGYAHAWSWLGIRSPLMSAKGEPEWVLSQLVVQLRKELSIDKMASPNTLPPLISLDMLQSLDVDGAASY